MRKTMDMIVASAKSPLSIIIVGIGNADFSKMEVLDADDKALTSSRGEKASRDIVQFVKFNDHKKQGVGALAQAVLGELPDQLTLYYSKMGIKPQEERKYEEDETNFRAMTTQIY